MSSKIFNEARSYLSAILQSCLDYSGSAFGSAHGHETQVHQRGRSGSGLGVEDSMTNAAGELHSSVCSKIVLDLGLIASKSVSALTSAGVSGAHSVVHSTSNLASMPFSEGLRAEVVTFSRTEVASSKSSSVPAARTTKTGTKASQAVGALPISGNSMWRRSRSTVMMTIGHFESLLYAYRPVALPLSHISACSLRLSVDSLASRILLSVPKQKNSSAAPIPQTLSSRKAISSFWNSLSRAHSPGVVCVHIVNANASSEQLLRAEKIVNRMIRYLQFAGFCAASSAGRMNTQKSMMSRGTVTADGLTNLTSACVRAEIPVLIFVPASELESSSFKFDGISVRIRYPLEKGSADQHVLLRNLVQHLQSSSGDKSPELSGTAVRKSGSHSTLSSLGAQPAAPHSATSSSVSVGEMFTPPLSISSSAASATIPNVIFVERAASVAASSAGIAAGSVKEKSLERKMNKEKAQYAQKSIMYLQRLQLPVGGSQASPMGTPVLVSDLPLFELRDLGSFVLKLCNSRYSPKKDDLEIFLTSKEPAARKPFRSLFFEISRLCVAAARSTAGGSSTTLGSQNAMHSLSHGGASSSSSSSVSSIAVPAGAQLTVLVCSSGEDGFDVITIGLAEMYKKLVILCAGSPSLNSLLGQVSSGR